MRRTDLPAGLAPPPTLKKRYRPADLSVFNPMERHRFLGFLEPLDLLKLEEDAEAWDRLLDSVAWELLYRIEPHLYDRLISGEAIHPKIIDWLPHVAMALEIGAGTGRFTIPLSGKATRVIAVEPAAPLRAMLRGKVHQRPVLNVEISDGFFDDLPADDGAADLVVTCSAFTPHDSHGGELGLEEMERTCSRGGMILIVWPTEADWFTNRGFEYVEFEGEMYVDYGSRAEALEICSIFYPWALDEVSKDGRIPYDVLGMRPPNNLAFKKLE